MKIIIGVARGLCYLHPTFLHLNLKSYVSCGVLLRWINKIILIFTEPMFLWMKLTLLKLQILALDYQL